MPRHDPVTTDRRRSDQHVIDEDCYRIRGLTDVRMVIDVGACYGSFIRHVKALYPQAQILAFEPNPEYLDDEAWQAAMVVRAAVSDRDKMAEYAIGKTPSCGGLTAVHQPRRGTIGVKQVQCVTLEPYLRGRTIDILKLDCEGSEVDVLRSLSSAAIECCRYICGEYHGESVVPDIVTMLCATHAIEVEELKVDRGHFFARRIT